MTKRCRQATRLLIIKQTALQTDAEPSLGGCSIEIKCKRKAKKYVYSPLHGENRETQFGHDRMRHADSHA